MRLGVDQTTISRRLRGLEDATGVLLATRNRSGIELTNAGLKAAHSAEIMETVSNDLELTLAGTDSRLAGRLKVTTLDFVTHFHPDLFTSFAAHYPNVDIEVETHTDLRSLARREADVAIRWTSDPGDGVVAQKLARAEFALYASRDLVKMIGRQSGLSNYPWLAFTAGNKSILVDDFIRKHAPDARTLCRYDNAMSMHAGIKAGKGIGFMPCAFGDPDPELERLHPIQPNFGNDIWCLAHAELIRTARVRTFLTHVNAFFAAREQQYAGNCPDVG